MNIHEEFVNQVLLKRKVALRDIISGNKSLQLENFQPNAGKIISSLDSIFYTIDFLERNKLILVNKEDHSSFDIGLFNHCQLTEEEIDSVLYFDNKLEKEYASSWNIEMQPGLIAFKQNGYKTDEQIKDRNNIWLAIGVGLGASFVTAILTALLSHPQIICSMK